MITAQLDHKIRAFQRQENLKDDGRVNPGGETITTMSNKLAEKKTMTPPPRKPRVLEHLDNEKTLQNIYDYEGDVSYMYKDSTGNVTVGLGKKLSNPDSANSLKFEKYIGRTDIRTKKETYDVVGMASQEEIEDAFNKIKSDGLQGYVAEHYNPSHNKNYSSIKLPDETKKAIALSSLFEHKDILKNRFKDFDQFPSSAQEALLDMQYNTGLNPSEWTNFYKAVREKDWERAAKYSNRANLNEKRNKWTFDSFMRSGN